MIYLPTYDYYCDSNHCSPISLYNQDSLSSFHLTITTGVTTAITIGVTTIVPTITIAIVYHHPSF